MTYYDDYEEDMTEIPAEETPKGGLTVTLDMDQYLSGPLQNIIVNSLVAQLAKMLESRIGEAVETKVLELADAEFAKVAEAKLEEYFVKSHRKTNQWGEPTGTEITMREMLEQQFKSYLDQKVDSEGRPTNYSNSLPRSQWLLNRLGHKPLEEAVNKTVGDIAKKAKEQIQASVSRYIAEQLAPQIDVPKLS